MAVSGEFRYFGPALSSVASARPVKAMTLPASLVMGNMMRLRKREYNAEFSPPPFSCCFQASRPLAFSDSSSAAERRRSRNRNPDSGA